MWWLWRNWLAHWIVVPGVGGSSPLSHPLSIRFESRCPFRSNRCWYFVSPLLRVPNALKIIGSTVSLTNRQWPSANPMLTPWVCWLPKLSSMSSPAALGFLIELMGQAADPTHSEHSDEFQVVICWYVNSSPEPMYQ